MKTPITAPKKTRRLSPSLKKQIIDFESRYDLSDMSEYNFVKKTTDAARVNRYTMFETLQSITTRYCKIDPALRDGEEPWSYSTVYEILGDFVPKFLNWSLGRIDYPIDWCHYGNNDAFWYYDQIFTAIEKMIADFDRNDTQLFLPNEVDEAEIAFSIAWKTLDHLERHQPRHKAHRKRPAVKSR